MLRTRVATALVALPLLYVTIVHGPPPLFAGVVVAASAAALYEYFQMAFPARRAERIAGVSLGLLVAGGVAAHREDLWGLGIAGAVAGGLLFCLFDAEQMAAAVTRAGHLMLGVLYAGFLISHCILLHRIADGRWWVVFTIVVAMASDTGGFFVGRSLGRHPLAATVSPKKTVEGAFGALAAAVVAAVVAQLTFFRRPSWAEPVLLGLVIGVLGQLGDLVESMLKRAFGAKDSGWIIPGHGGILDRLDSLVFPVVFSYYYAVVAHG